MRHPVHFPPSRPPQYETEFHGDVRVPSSVPGLTLGADMYLPRTTAKVPALVTLHTGRKDGLGGVAASRYLRYFAERGYAVLYVDCFGIGTSDGLPRPILSPGEVDDGVSMVQWASQQPWCTGSVGMWGLSHGGMTTLAVASRRPAALRAIFPVMGWADVERDLVHPGGLRGGIGMFGHLSLYNIFSALLPPLRAHDKTEYANLWKERLDKFEPWFADSWNHPPGHQVWAQRRFDPRLITVPALCVAGWRDLFCDAMIEIYQQIKAPKSLLIGPWLHSFPDVSGTEPVASAAMACAWWDRWLHGGHRPARPEQSTTFYVQGTGRWARCEHWPPAKKGDHVFVAAGSGHLYQSAPNGRPSIVVTATRMSDATVGALSGLTKHPIDKFGYPLDQHDDDARSLSFTSAPLPEPVVIAGRPLVRLLLAPETTAARCVVKVTDVDGQGRSTMIAMGTVDLTRPRSTGSPELVPVHLDPTCYQVPAGHRVRLVLAESDIPRLWPVESPGKLVVRVIHAAGDYVGLAAEGYGGLAATTLRLPLCDPATLPNVVVPQQQKRLRPPGVRKDRWEITRDHLRDSIRVTVAKEDRVRSPDSDQDSLAMKTLVVLGVNEHHPADARMIASGEMTAETAEGDQVAVRADIDMGTTDATVTAEVVVNGTQFLLREWNLT